MSLTKSVNIASVLTAINGINIPNAMKHLVWLRSTYSDDDKPVKPTPGRRFIQTRVQVGVIRGPKMDEESDERDEMKRETCMLSVTDLTNSDSLTA